MPTKGDLDIFDDSVWWQIQQVLQVHTRLELHIVNRAGARVVEMPMIVKVRTIPRWLTVKIHLPDNVVLHQRLKTVIHCRQGYRRELFFDLHENLIRRRVRPLAPKKAINFLALAGHPKAVDFLWHFPIPV